MFITLVKVFNMNKLLLLSLGDYALTFLHFKDVFVQHVNKRSMFFGNHILSQTYVI